MELENSFPYSQTSAIGSYAEPSNPHLNITLILILSSYQSLQIPSGVLLSGFLTESLLRISHVRHASTCLTHFIPCLINTVTTLSEENRL